MSRIVVVSLGTRGDVQPYVALGRGLQAAGHDVVIGTHPMFEDFVTQHGLTLAPIRVDPRAAMDQDVSAISGKPYPYATLAQRTVRSTVGGLR